MARSLTSRQEELVGRVGRQALPLVVITTYSDKGAGTVDTTFYVSDRAGVIYDYGNAGTLRHFRPALISIDRLRTSMTHLPPAQEGASPTARTVNLVLAQDPLELAGTPFLAELRAKHLEFATVELAELDLNPQAGEGPLDLRALAGDEHVVWARFEVAHVSRADAESFTLQLRSREPEIPVVLLSDAANNQPEHVGQRKNVLYGAFENVECHGTTVGFTTTLVTKLSADGIGDFDVTSTIGFPGSGSFAVRIGGEEIEVSEVDADTLNIASGKRAQNGTLAAEHLAGMPVVELISSAKWTVSDHSCKAVSVVKALNVYADELFKIPASLYSVNLNDSGETTITITAANMRLLLAAMQSSANAYTSASVSDELPIAGQANIIDGNTGTAYNLSSGSDPADATTDVTFDTPPGEITYQETIVNIAAFGGGGDGIIDVYFDGVYHASIAEATSGAQTYGTLYGVQVVTLSMDPAAPSRAIYDVRRNYDYKDGSTVEVSGAEVGYDLRLFATGEGYAAPDGTNYSVASGALLEHPSDILRHLIAVRCGQGHGAISDSSFDAAVTALGTYKMRCNLWDLGDAFPEIAGRIAFEACCNLVQEETSSGTVWRLLAPTYDSGNKVYEFSTSGAVTLEDLNWGEAEEVGQEADTIFTRFAVHYDRDPSIDDPEEAFRAVYRADRVQNDISAQFATAEFTTAEEKFGRRDHPGFRLYCVADASSARFFAGYYAQEHLRAARTFEFRDVPWWRAYKIERGDLVLTTPSWVGAQLALRVVEHSHDLATSDLGLVAVEVRT